MGVVRVSRGTGRAKHRLPPRYLAEGGRGYTVSGMKGPRPRKRRTGPRQMRRRKGESKQRFLREHALAEAPHGRWVRVDIDRMYRFG